ncbi:MAG TPA: sodium:proton antiporter [Bryobacteraceae bacterium]|nr:sodium:proton antiporter [Bryobacteraceae bacterium]
MQFDFENSAVLLLLIAAVVAILTRRLRLPYSVGLVAAGMALALVPFAPKINLTRELIFTGLLPPLIFEAAFYLRWKDLRRDMPVILVLATVGVLVSAAITTAGMHFFAHWEWVSALVFGALIAATDPVSVIAVFREAKAHGRLRLLVEAESLFNDGTAAVAFGIAVALASGHSLSGLAMARTALVTTGGGILCGALVGNLVLYLIVSTQDHLVETTCTTIAAYGSFLLADSLQVSGVFATLTAGLILGNLGTQGRISDRGREAVQAFWEYGAFIANSVVFLLIGMHEPIRNINLVWFSALIAALLVTLGRAATIYPLCGLFARSSLRVSRRHQHVLFWGGLRGALALALVLGIPDDVPRREEIVTVSFAVVAFSIFVHGLTIAPLLRRLGEIGPKPEMANDQTT